MAYSLRPNPAPTKAEVGEAGRARRSLTVYGLAMPSSELIWRGDMSTVGRMRSTAKIKPRDLVVGGRYLHRNGLFIRQIEAIEGNTVHYHDQESSWSCSNSVFVRTCPTLATLEDEARVAEDYRKLARLERK